MTAKPRVDPPPGAVAVAVAVAVAYAQLLDQVWAVPPPCAQAPELWVGDQPDLEAAAFGCLRCHAFTACGTYAELAEERHGVWAAVLRINGRRRVLVADELEEVDCRA